MLRTWIVSSRAIDHDGVSCAVTPEALRQQIVALWNHNEDTVIGHWENFRWDGHALLADLKPLPSLAELFPVVSALLASKTPLGASIEATEYIVQNAGVWHITRVGEISLVTVPSNPDCYEVNPS